MLLDCVEPIGHQASIGDKISKWIDRWQVQSGSQRPGGKLSLVDDDTIEHEILSSRLALAMMDRASWEFTDLRSRMNVLEKREELDTNDILRPHVLARVVTNSWLAVPLGFEAWRVLHTVLPPETFEFARKTMDGMMEGALDPDEHDGLR